MHSIGVAVADDDGRRADLDRIEARPQPDVRHVHDDAEVVEHLHDIVAELRQSTVGSFEAAVTDAVAVIVSELHDTQTKRVEGVDEAEVVFDWIRALQLHRDGDVACRCGRLDVVDGTYQPEGQRGGPGQLQPLAEYPEHGPWVLD